MLVAAACRLAFLSRALSLPGRRCLPLHSRQGACTVCKRLKASTFFIDLIEIYAETICSFPGLTMSNSSRVMFPFRRYPHPDVQLYTPCVPYHSYGILSFYRTAQILPLGPFR
jgi:hypothetical protein